MELEQNRTQNLIVATDPTTLVFPKIRDAKLIANISRRINVWTNGQPFLTYLIHHYLNQYSAQIVSSAGPDIVNEIVSQKIIKNWRENEAAAHLIAIEQAILTHPLRDELLILHMRFLWLYTIQSLPYIPPQTQVHLRSSGEKSLLFRVGLLRREGERLRVANAIYAAVFNQNWLEEQLPGITRGVSVSLPDAVSPVVPLDRSNVASNVSSTVSLAALFDFSLPFLSAFSSVFAFAGHSSVFSGLKQIALKQRSRSKLSQSKLSAPQFKLLVGLCGLLLSLATLAHAQTDRFNPVAQIAAEKSTHELTGKSTIKPTTKSTTKPTAHKQAVVSSRDLFDQGMNHAENGRWLSTLHKFCQIPTDSVYFAAAQQQLIQWTALYPEDMQKANHGLRIKKNKPCGLSEKVLNSVEG